MDTFNISNDTTFHLWRGPTIIILSLLTLLVPQILTASCSLPTLALLLSTGIAFYIAITDMISYVQWKYTNIKHTILNQCNEIILDEWLQNTIGYISASYGLAITTILLYSFPMSQTFRIQMIQYLSSHVPMLQEHNIHEIMYQPGGLSRLISIFFAKDTSTMETIKSTMDTTTVDSISIPILQVQTQYMNDLHYQQEEHEYVEDEEDYETNKTNQTKTEEPEHHHHDIPSSTFSSTAESTSTSTTLHESHTNHHHHHHNHHHHDHHCHHQQHTSRLPNNIPMDILPFLLELSLSKINQDKIQRIGIGAGLALCVQMKYSPVARNTFKHVLQGSIVIGLSSLILGSCASVYAKKRVRKWMLQMMEEDNEEQEARKSKKDKNKRNHSSNMIQYGHGVWMSLVYKFKHDEGFRRKWKGFLCIMVLYILRKQHSIRSRHYGYKHE
jgi:hypothetical protein